MIKSFQKCSMKSGYSIKRKVTEATDIPKDVLLGTSILSVTGFSEISLENHIGIIEYSDTIIRIRTKSGQIRISGKKLQVDLYTNDEIKLNGTIDSIEFCR